MLKKEPASMMLGVIGRRGDMEWEAVGEFKIRNRVTKERMGSVRVRRSDTNLVELGVFMTDEIEINGVACWNNTLLCQGQWQVN